MKISTRGRYALRLMVDIAHESKGAFVPLKEVASRQDISFKYLEQISSLLCKRGMLQSQRGTNGGYRLKKPAHEYTAGEILRVIEGELAPVGCEEETLICATCVQCSTLPFWQGMYKAVNDYADSITLEQMLQSTKLLC